jgi:hypothetical protein
MKIWVPQVLLDVYDLLTGRGLKPFSVQLFSRFPELNDQTARQILRLGLTAFFLPKPDQLSFVNAHNDPGIGPTNKLASVIPLAGFQFRFQNSLLWRI